MAHWLCCEPTPRKVRFRIAGNLPHGTFWVTGAVEVDDISDDAALEYVHNSYGPRDLVENAIREPDYDYETTRGDWGSGSDCLLAATGPVTVDLECNEDA